MNAKKNVWTTRRIVYIAVLSALVCAVTFFRFPLLGSKIHFANAMCLLSGLLMGPMAGGLARGGGAETEETSRGRITLASAAGALFYVALYMAKTVIFQLFLYGYPMETALVTAGSKLPASLLNAIAAMVAAPLLYAALVPALRRAGQLNGLRA